MPEDVANGFERRSVLQEMDRQRMAKTVWALNGNAQTAPSNDGLKDLFSRIPKFEWEIAQYQNYLPMQEQEQPTKSPAEIVQEQQQAAQGIFNKDQQPN